MFLTSMFPSLPLSPKSVSMPRGEDRQKNKVGKIDFELLNKAMGLKVLKVSILNLFFTCLKNLQLAVI